MVELYLIRHGKTYGNTLGRYIGTTDESLCAEGVRELEQKNFPAVDLLYASPLKRCVETARYIPRRTAALRDGAPEASDGEWSVPRLCEKLRECDFGDFENRNYRELEKNPDYQRWIDSGGKLPFPNGESHEDFKERCREGFLEALADLQNYRRDRRLSDITAAFVVHGGTIMSILEAFAESGKDFYCWQVKNGCGYRVCWNEREKGEAKLYGTIYTGFDSGISAGSAPR